MLQTGQSQIYYKYIFKASENFRSNILKLQKKRKTFHVSKDFYLSFSLQVLSDSGCLLKSWLDHSEPQLWKREPSKNSEWVCATNFTNRNPEGNVQLLFFTEYLLSLGAIQKAGKLTQKLPEGEVKSPKVLIEVAYLKHTVSLSGKSRCFEATLIRRLKGWAVISEMQS